MVRAPPACDKKRRDVSRFAREWRRSVSALALACVGLSSWGVRAEDRESLPRLVVRRSAAARDCPDAEAIAAAVGRFMKRPAVAAVSESAALYGSSSDPPTIEVDITREGAYRATIVAGDRSRQLQDDGPTCAGLAEALPISLTIILDTDLPSRPARSRRAPAPPRADGSVLAPDATAGRAPTPPAHVPVLATELGVGLSMGLVKPVSPAFRADVDVRVADRFSFGLGGLWIPTQSIDYPPGQVDVWLLAGALRQCAVPVGTVDSTRLTLCGLFPTLGAVHGQGRGYNPDRTVTRPWFAAGAIGRLDGPISGALGWALGAAILVPLGREQFEVKGVGIAYEPWPAGAALTAGLRAILW
jgi:hypothetical protein